MENLENNKMYQAIVELRTKGSFQEQAKELRELEKMYKRLLNECNRQIRECMDDEEYDDLVDIRYRYRNKLDNIRIEMCKLNGRIQENMKTFDELIETQCMDVEVFLDAFNMEYEEWDEEEDCYFNLLGSMTDIGHCLRTALIHSEKLMKELN